jgi:hypothetical protein
MSDENETEEKVCGFDKKPCIRDKCNFWVEIGVAGPGMIAPQKQGMCVFRALLIIAGSPKPQMPGNVPPVLKGTGSR